MTLIAERRINAHLIQVVQDGRTYRVLVDGEEWYQHEDIYQAKFIANLYIDLFWNEM